VSLQLGVSSEPQLLSLACAGRSCFIIPSHTDPVTSLRAPVLLLPNLSSAKGNPFFLTTDHVCFHFCCFWESGTTSACHLRGSYSWASLQAELQSPCQVSVLLGTVNSMSLRLWP
jgi:hypothetical protein